MPEAVYHHAPLEAWLVSEAPMRRCVTRQRGPANQLVWGRPTKEDEIRTSQPGRRCVKCDRKLSIYNHGKECAQCVTA